jgi:MoaA/NifB/PqqE/SkfB family radical SAM enzyme
MTIKDPVHVNHVWLFMTDKCNLRCGHCFFRHKTGKRVMSQDVFKAAVDLCPARGEFIFSGGEPLSAWGDLARMITRVRQRYPKRYVAVQTNATLMNGHRAAFLAGKSVSVEVGIDGDEATTLAHRPGSGICYKDVVRGVKVVVQSGVSLTATMTVHPSSASRLLENVKVLAGMGLHSIEVHPAFLEAWDRRSSAIFVEQYRRAAAWELKEGRVGVIGRGYSARAGGAWDMVVLPDGKVLPSWVFLSFPEKVRAAFYVMDLGGGRVRHLPSGEAYFDRLGRFLKRTSGMPSYRRLSNYNALLAVRSPGGRSYAARVGRYIKLCEAVERIDCKV